jgi:hypothetical protein
MVVFQQSGRFYARNAAGKYPLDVFELRQSFLGGGSIAERARQFRVERIGHLAAGESPAPLNGDRVICVHFIPHASLAGGVDVDILKAANEHDWVTPFCADYSGRQRFNLDGLLTYRPTANEAATNAYLQLYRNGIVESATINMVRPREGYGLSVPSLALAQQLAAFVDRARGLMRRLEVNPPASLFVSALNVREVLLAVSEKLTFYGACDNPTPFDRDHLLMREVTLMDWEGVAFDILKPLLNELWQAAGLRRCFDYNEAGEWKPHAY